MRIRTCHIISIKAVAYLVAVFLLFGGAVKAQKVSFDAEVDTAVITIGQQFRLELEAACPAGLRYLWPAVADTFQGFEVISRSGIDTIASTEGSIVCRQQIVLTSFDSGYRVIPPFRAVFTGSGSPDSLIAETDPLLITVHTVPVDTAKAIKDIKDLVRYPYTWQDALPWIFGTLLLILIGWLVYYFLKNRKAAAIPVPEAPAVPPHEKALRELEQIDNAKLWQQGQFKMYHSRIIDVIRNYIQETRMVNAPEMTTNEILSLSIINSLPNKQYLSLKQLLELSDLVKFAKMHPLPADNEQSMLLAVAFINEDSLRSVENNPKLP